MANNTTKGSFERIEKAVEKSMEKAMKKGMLNGAEKANKNTTVDVNPNKIVVNSIDITDLFNLDDAGLVSKIKELYKKAADEASSEIDKELISAMQVASHRKIKMTESGGGDFLKNNLSAYEGFYKNYIEKSFKKIEDYYRKKPLISESNFVDKNNKKPTDRLDTVVRNWRRDDASKTNERYTAFNSSSLKTSGIHAAAEAESVSKQLILSAIKEMGGDADGFIHSHPNNVAAFSDDDIDAAYKLLKEGVSKQIVTSFNDAMVLDMGKVKASSQKSVVNKLRKEYTKAEDEITDKFLHKNIQTVRLMANDIFDKNITGQNPKTDELITKAKEEYNKRLDKTKIDKLTFEDYGNIVDDVLTQVFERSAFGQQPGTEIYEIVKKSMGNIADEIVESVGNLDIVQDAIQSRFQSILLDVFSDPRYLKKGIDSAIKVVDIAELLNNPMDAITVGEQASKVNTRKKNDNTKDLIKEQEQLKESIEETNDVLKLQQELAEKQKQLKEIDSKRKIGYAIKKENPNGKPFYYRDENGDLFTNQQDAKEYQEAYEVEGKIVKTQYLSKDLRAQELVLRSEVKNLEQQILDIQKKENEVAKESKDKTSEIEAQNKLQEELIETREEAKKTEEAVEKVNESDSKPKVSSTTNIEQTEKELDKVEEKIADITSGLEGKTFDELIDISNIKKGSDELNAALRESMEHLKAMYDAGETKSEEYMGTLYRIINLQKLMWRFNGGNYPGYDFYSEQTKQKGDKKISAKMKLQDSIFKDFMDFSGVSKDTVDAVSQIFTDLKFKKDKIFDDKGKLISLDVYKGVQKISEELKDNVASFDKFQEFGQQATTATDQAKQGLAEMREEASKTSDALKNITTLKGLENYVSSIDIAKLSIQELEQIVSKVDDVSTPLDRSPEFLEKIGDRSRQLGYIFDVNEGFVRLEDYINSADISLMNLLQDYSGFSRTAGAEEGTQKIAQGILKIVESEGKLDTRQLEEFYQLLEEVKSSGWNENIQKSFLNLKSQPSNETPVSTTESTANINAETEALEREEQQARETAEAKKAASDIPNQIMIDEYTERLREEKEQQAKQDIGYSSSIEATDKSAGEEAEKLGKVAENATEASKAKKLFADANGEVLESILKSLSALNSEGDGFKHLNSIINKISNDDKSDKLVENLKKIRNALNTPMKDNSLLNAVKEIASQGDNLNSLATVLKATVGQINKAKTAVADNQKAPESSDDNLEKIKKATELYKQIAKDQKWQNKNKEGTNVPEYEERAESIRRARAELDALKLSEQQNAQAVANARKEMVAADNAAAEAERKLNLEREKSAETARREQVQAIKQATSMMSNGKLMAEYGDQVKEVLSKIRAINPNFESDEAVKSIRKLRDELTLISSSANEAGKSGKTLTQMLAQRFKSLVAYLGTFVQFYDIVRYTRQAFETIKDLDTQLVDLRKTTAMNTAELNEFYNASSDVAKGLGVTTSEIISQAAAWSRLGYNTKEASTQMAQLSSKFASVSPGMTTENATDYLVSTMQAYGIAVDEVERKVMDNVNRIGNTFATTNAEIGEMLTRSSAAMNAANNSLEETIALESAAVEVTRNAEMTGTAFRTVSMRIRGKQLMPPYSESYMLCA